MPPLTNGRHEKFAQALAKGMTADDAYQAAGYNEHRGNAHRLSTKESVRSRVTEIQARVADKAEWTAADRLRSLRAIHDATSDKEPRTAIAALAEANKMQGSYAPAKVQHSGAIGTYDLSKLTDDEIDRLEAILGPLADAGRDPGGEGQAGG